MSLLYNPQFGAPTAPVESSPAAPPGVRTIKVKYNDDYRRFPFPLDAADDGQYAALVCALASSYGVARDALLVQYVDDEGDLVTVGSDAELAEAVRCNESHILRLSLALKGGDVAAAPAVASSVTSADGGMPAYPKLQDGARWGDRRGAAHGCRGQGRGMGLGLGLGLGIGKFMAKGRLMQRREELEEKYAAQVAVLKSEGLPHGPFVLAALERLDGDMDELLRRLRARQERVAAVEAQYAGELAQLREMGVLKSEDEQEAQPGAKPKFCRNPKNHCLRLLVKTDGDVEKVAKKLRKWEEKRESWRQKTEKLKTRFSSELAQLEEMGFTNTHCLIRLLNSCDGDVGKVIDRLGRLEQQKKKRQR